MAAGVPAAVVLVTGVSGSGKSTVARLLADRLGWVYKDADDFHTPASRARMAAGETLTDEDRRPWLTAVATWIDRQIAARQPAVVSCSALTSSRPSCWTASSRISRSRNPTNTPA
ncbi:gluconokinase [Streptomyces sp. BP-8]|uniref:gluconokinase n=1 Tax=Streptomyces sirii TaxID=3127701 RepID=A0ABZ2QDX2_9ACTN